MQGACRTNDVRDLANKAVILDNKLSISWEYSPSGIHIDILVEIYHEHWFGLGIGKGMLEADMWIFEIGLNGEVNALDGWSYVAKRPSYDVDIGGKDDIEVINIVFFS
jgi:hypothetical protein